MLQLSIKDPLILAKICHALSTEMRLSIIALLENQTMSCLELSNELGYPMSTISANVKILEEAGLIITELLPAKHGSKKLCSLVYIDVSIDLGSIAVLPKNTKHYEIFVPIGNYMSYQVAPSCGFVTDTMKPEWFDNSNYFMDPSRINAQLLWFRKGYVEYQIPVNHSLSKEPESISFELEICSEAPGFNNKWKSDITMWINNIEIGTWTSPADFGDRRGYLTPEFWEIGATQYGILTKWSVNEEYTTVNNEPVSSIKIQELALNDKSYVTMRIGVKDTSEHVGGINIFGENFGDYAQNIKMNIHY